MVIEIWFLIKVKIKFVSANWCNSYMGFRLCMIFWFGFEGNYTMPECSGLLDESCSMPSQAEVCMDIRVDFALCLLFELKPVFCFSCVHLLFVFGACSDWARVEEDCRRAIQLDNNSVKVSAIPLLYCCTLMCLILTYRHFLVG